MKRKTSPCRTTRPRTSSRKTQKIGANAQSSTGNGQDIVTHEDRTIGENERRSTLLDLYKNYPIPESELLANLGLFISKQEFARVLYLHDLYKKILDVHGVIMEFGIRWGQNVALFQTMRGIYEPFNRNRKVIGFDTFEGFPSICEKDGTADIVARGAYSVTRGYENSLQVLLSVHEQEGVQRPSPGFELRKGDASVQIKKYLEEHPETVIALAYFDFDLYEPTKECLQAIRPYLTKGSVVAFDELNYDVFPGETVAVREVFGLDKYKLHHTPYSSNRSYVVID